MPKTTRTGIAAVAVALTVSLTPALLVPTSSALAGEKITVTRDVSDFDTIRLSGSFSGTVVVGDKESLTLTGDKKLEDQFVAEVHGNELRIKLTKKHRHHGKIKIAIEAKELEKFIVEGAGKFTITGVDSEDFDIKLPGAASITVEGKCGELGIAIAGAATVDAEKLICEHGRVRISGTGTISLHASESIDARVSGLGKIEVYGNPKEIDQRISGLGRIKLK